MADQWPEEYYNGSEGHGRPDMPGVDQVQYVDYPSNYPEQDKHQMDYQIPSESTYDGMDSPTPQPVRDVGHYNMHPPTPQMQQRQQRVVTGQRAYPVSHLHDHESHRYGLALLAGSFARGFGPDSHAVPISPYNDQYRQNVPLSQPSRPSVAGGIRLVPVSQLRG